MTFAVIKKQLTELIDDRKSLVSKDAEHDEIYLKDIEALESAINILDYHKSLKRSFENLVQQLVSEQQATVTECCPHCDTRYLLSGFLLRTVTAYIVQNAVSVLCFAPNALQQTMNLRAIGQQIKRPAVRGMRR